VAGLLKYKGGKTMFEIGTWYEVKMWEDGADGGLITTYGAAEVIEVSLPLVKFKSGALWGGNEIILNTASLAFVSAEEKSAS
jgi:hypothetical protein